MTKATEKLTKMLGRIAQLEMQNELLAKALQARDVEIERLRYEHEKNSKDFVAFRSGQAEILREVRLDLLSSQEDCRGMQMRVDALVSAIMLMDKMLNEIDTSRQNRRKDKVALAC